MKIYNYHPETKEYLGEEFADIDPLESAIQGCQVYLIPAYSTNIKPPETKNNTVAVFENDNWAIKPDFRGKVCFDIDTKEQIIIGQIGELPPNLVAERPSLNTVELKEIKQKNINQEAKQFLSNTDWKVLRHIEEFELGEKTTLTKEEFKKLLEERKKAREKSKVNK